MIQNSLSILTVWMFKHQLGVLSFSRFKAFGPVSPCVEDIISVTPLWLLGSWMCAYVFVPCVQEFTRAPKGGKSVAQWRPFSVSSVRLPLQVDRTHRSPSRTEDWNPGLDRLQGNSHKQVSLFSCASAWLFCVIAAPLMQIINSHSQRRFTLRRPITVSRVSQRDAGWEDVCL